MPEAPEVASVLSFLEQELKDRKIVKATITHPKLAENMDPEVLCQKLENQHFRRFLRHGKYLIFEMDDVDWLSHLRMEGKFLLADAMPEDPKTAKHIHAVFDLDDGRKLLYYDTRKFGRMQVYDKVDDIRTLPPIQKMGLDVLDPHLDGQALKKKLGKRKIPIKQALLDQSIVAGIGNIYADEILFYAGIDPRSTSSHLSLEDCSHIVQGIKAIIGASMEHGGTTIRTFSYGHGTAGTFQNLLKVHDREKEPCPSCQMPIEKILVGQRSTYLCPNCQVRK